MFDDTPHPSHPLVTVIIDLVIKLFIHTPSMQRKLGSIASDSEQLHQSVEKLFLDVSAKLSTDDLNALTEYFTDQVAQNTLLGCFSKAFIAIFQDGVIDENDTVHLLALVHTVVSMFNSTKKRASKPLTISSEGIILFLYFVLKSILINTLEQDTEEAALQVLTHAFQLLQLSIKPIEIGLDTRCCPLSLCSRVPA